jgi:predicted amidohydrolase YtcJ
MKTYFWIMCLALLSACHFSTTQVDMIVHNATIYQVDDMFNKAEAMAIHQGKIVAIGAEREIMNAYSSDQIVDAQKQYIYPGFIDAHCHFLYDGLLGLQVNLVGTKSWKEVLDKVVLYANEHPRDWIIGRGWDQNDWPIMELPDKRALDSLFPSTPVWLTRIDGHAGIANQKALDLAGIREGKEILGGERVVKNNRLTGVLIDNAMTEVQDVLPAYTREEKVQALLAEQKKAWEFGLTSVGDAGLVLNEIQLIDSLQKAGALQMKMYVMAADDPATLDYYLQKGIDTSSQWLTVTGFKFYADGALGSRGACLKKPYADLLTKGRKEYGKMLKTRAYYAEKFWALKEAGFQVCTHAIGDSANHEILSLYAAMLGGVNDLRWRIEHAQVVDDEDIHYFHENSIIPSVQPTHATSDAPWAFERLGNNRVRLAYRYKTLLKENGMLALGTDFPVEEVDPLNTFFAAVFRKSRTALGDATVFQPEEALSPEEALRGMTIWAALAQREEHKKGSLEIGKAADFVIINTDLLTATEDQVRLAKVINTFSNGVMR